MNTYTTSDQSNPDVADDGTGNLVVVWQDGSGQDGDTTGVFGQRYDSSGEPVGSEFLVNTYTTGGQNMPAAAADAAGNLLVVWQDGGQDGDLGGIQAQRYDGSGATVGAEFQVNTFTTGDQSKPAVAAAADGGFVAVWTGLDSDLSGIVGQRYARSGAMAGTEFAVNTYTTGAQDVSAVAADADGDFMVTWRSPAQEDNLGGIFAQRYDSAGAAAGTEFRVNTVTGPLDQTDPAVAASADGNFIVVWASNAQDGNAYGIFGQRYDSGGAAVGSEFQVNSYTLFNQYYPAVAAKADGSFVVTWQSMFQDHPLGPGIFAQRYDSAGGPVGGVSGEYHVLRLSELSGCCRGRRPRRGRMGRQRRPRR